MASKKRILILINPISGRGDSEYLPNIFEKEFSEWDMSIKFTQRANHAFELAQKAAKDSIDVVVAVGGDGTINETASALCGSRTALGIIPRGSGNGLARHLHIPLDIKKAIEVIKYGNVAAVDYCTANDQPFFCTFGVGFDAQVSKTFAENGKKGHRGPIGYVKSAVSEYLKYRSQHYQIDTPQGTIAEKAFIIACGNASQYGNNAYITPYADMQDGLIDVTVVLPITPLDTAVLGILLFSKHIDQDNNIISFQVPYLSIDRESPGIVHIDGEPMMMGAHIDVNCHAQALFVVTPQKIITERQSMLTTIETSFWEFVKSIRSELDI